MAVLEDFAPYFTEFGIRAELGGEGVDGIFDRPYREPFGMASAGPTWTMPTARVPTGTAAGTEFSFDADTAATLGAATHWRVRSVEPDGTGVSVLTLELVG